MAGPAGTLELLAHEVGAALAGLEERLSGPGGLENLVGELGLRPPPSLLADGALSAAASDAAGAAAALPPLVADLVAAIAADDPIAVAAAGAALVAAIAAAIAALDVLGAALRAAAASAGTLTPAQRADVEAFAAGLPRRLLDHLLVTHLSARAPRVLGGLDALGLVDDAIDPGVPGDALHPPHRRRLVHLDRIPVLLSDPLGYLRTVYGWGEPGFDAVALFDRLERFLTVLNLPAVRLAPPGEPPILEAYVIALRPDPATVPPSLVASLRFPGAQTVTNTYVLADPWRIEMTATGAFVADLQARVTPPLNLELRPPTGAVDATIQASVRTSLVGERAGGTVLILGAAGGTRLEARRVALGFGAEFSFDAGQGRATAVPSASAELADGLLVVSLGGADGFLASVLPGALQAKLDLDADWDPDDGLTFRAGAGLEVPIPLDVTLGPVRLEQLTVALGLSNEALSLALKLTGGISLGPFDAVVQGVGAAADLRFVRGNLGPADIVFRFVPPTGLGLSVEAGPITGGGFIGFEPAIGRYSGIFQLRLGPVGVTAMGLLDTRLPGGQRGFALLVALRASFPPIQVGFGFALSSVGGILALNRRIDVDALRMRMATGTAGRILNPEDPIRNAPVLISDLSAVFPPEGGIVVVGPTLQLSWAELVRFDLGVFIELPGPRKIVLLGSARVVVDNPAGGRPFLQLRLDIVGLLDFARAVLEFDAVLVDSHILEVFEIFGGAAFRLSWGAEPYVVLSVGGFHPAYNPAPLVFPSSLTRVGMVQGTPTSPLYLRFEGYFAVTTNTLQFGAAVEAVVRAGDFDARGFLGFDALIRFQPFSFEFDFAASVRLRYKSRTLAGVSLKGTITGPGPVTFRGRACIEILFFDICVSATFTLGSDTPPAVTPVASAVAELARELEDPVNLRPADVVDPGVTLAPPPSGVALPVVSARGQLAWSQDRAPLDLLLQRFEGAPLTTPETVTAAGPNLSGPEPDWFAPGSFCELSDADALSRRAFERLNGGARIGAAGLADGPASTHTVTMREIRLPAIERPILAVLLPLWLLKAGALRTGAVERDAVTPALTVADEAWQVRAPAGGLAAGGLSQAQAHQMAVVAGAGVAVPAGDLVATFSF